MCGNEGWRGVWMFWLFEWLWLSVCVVVRGCDSSEKSFCGCTFPFLATCSSDVSNTPQAVQAAVQASFFPAARRKLNTVPPSRWRRVVTSPCT